MKVLIDNHHNVNKMNAEYNELLLKAGRPPLRGPMFALMPWSDMPIDEFQRSQTGANLDSDHMEMTESSEAFEQTEETEAPALGQTTFTPVIRNQGSCGSCWAFSTIATIEKHFWTQTKQTLHFAQQQLVDCDSTNNGCSGGWMTKAIVHLGTSGIALASSYPYTGVKGATCNINPAYQVSTANLGAQQVLFTGAKAVAGAQKQLSMGTGVHVASNFYQLRAANDPYDVALHYPSQCTVGINHAVNIVEAGYELVGGKNRLWIKLQNSWGTVWGNNGFIKIYTCSENTIWGAATGATSTTPASTVIIHGTKTVVL